jgi:hypothetical protein
VCEGGVSAPSPGALHGDGEDGACDIQASRSSEGKEVTDRRNPTHSQSATFYIDGTKRGQGALLLYPDELAAVTTPTGTWGFLAGPALFLAVTIPLFHTIGWPGITATSLVGGWIGEALTKRRAARKAAAGGEGVTVIPLGLITGVQAAKPTKAAGWLGLRNITVTADGTKYEFRGTTDKWMAHLTSALTEYGREVHIAAETITVLPWATLEEG